MLRKKKRFDHCGSEGAKWKYTHVSVREIRGSVVMEMLLLVASTSLLIGFLQYNCQTGYPTGDQFQGTNGRCYHQG